MQCSWLSSRQSSGVGGQALLQQVRRRTESQWGGASVHISPSLAQIEKAFPFPKGRVTARLKHATPAQSPPRHRKEVIPIFIVHRR